MPLGISSFLSLMLMMCRYVVLVFCFVSRTGVVYSTLRVNYIHSEQKKIR